MCDYARNDEVTEPPELGQQPLRQQRQILIAAAAMAIFPMLAAVCAEAQTAEVVTIPQRDEGEGPFERLVLRGAYMIDGTPWELDIAEKLAANAITGPRFAVYPAFDAREAGSIATPAEARQRIRDIKRMGGSGVKFFGAPEDIMTAALDEARKQGLQMAGHDLQHVDAMCLHVLRKGIGIEAQSGSAGVSIFGKTTVSFVY